MCVFSSLSEQNPQRFARVLLFGWGRYLDARKMEKMSGPVKEAVLFLKKRTKKLFLMGCGV